MESTGSTAAIGLHTPFQLHFKKHAKTSQILKLAQSTRANSFFYVPCHSESPEGRGLSGIQSDCTVHSRKTLNSISSKLEPKALTR